MPLVMMLRSEPRVAGAPSMARPARALRGQRDHLVRALAGARSAALGQQGDGAHDGHVREGQPARRARWRRLHVGGAGGGEVGVDGVRAQEGKAGHCATAEALWP